MTAAMHALRCVPALKAKPYACKTSFYKGLQACCGKGESWTSRHTTVYVKPLLHFGPLNAAQQPNTQNGASTCTYELHSITGDAIHVPDNPKKNVLL